MTIHRSALFVDFDNIYGSLSNGDPEAAEEFATNPARWLTWLISEQQGDDKAGRRMLVRSCYINPYMFSKYRTYFTRDGFRVIDCPSLTQKNKSSADIHMVLDILDALQHPVPYDEFLILSGDTDFTPVLHRLREHDRRVTVLAAGTISPAYGAAADTLISNDVFVTEGLGVDADDEDGERTLTPARPSYSPSQLKDLVASSLLSLVQREGSIRYSELEARVYGRFLPQEELGSKGGWLGSRTLPRFTEEIVEREPRLEIRVEDTRKIVGLRDAADRTDEATASISELPSDKDLERLRQKARQIIAEYMREQPAAVPMATLAFKVRGELGSVVDATSWLGAGQFRHLVAMFTDWPYQIDRSGPSYLYDPENHSRPKEDPTSVARIGSLQLDRLARKLNRLIDIPRMPGETYRAAFEALAKFVRENDMGLPIHVFRASLFMRDRLNDQGHRSSRNDLNYIVRGINYNGIRFEPAAATWEVFWDSFVGNVANLCRQHQVDISPNELEMVRAWMGGQEDDADETTGDVPPSSRGNGSPAETLRRPNPEAATPDQTRLDIPGEALTRATTPETAPPAPDQISSDDVPRHQEPPANPNSPAARDDGTILPEEN